MPVDHAGEDVTEPGERLDAVQIAVDALRSALPQGRELRNRRVHGRYVGKRPAEQAKRPAVAEMRVGGKEGRHIIRYWLRGQDLNL